jgi:hypothetical protein
MHRRLGVVLLVVGLGLTLVACGDDGGDDVDTEATDGGDGISTGTTPTTIAGAMTPISVGEALMQQEGSRVTIQAFALEPDEGATTLCEVLGESFPPTCGGQMITVDGLDIDSLPGVQSTSGGDLVAPVTWTEGQVTVSGTLTAGRLVVDS